MFNHWAAGLRSGLLSQDSCSPQGGSLLSTVSIPVSLLEIDIPQKLQTPVNAELDVYAVKSQNETQFPERAHLYTERWP